MKLATAAGFCFIVLLNNGVFCSVQMITDQVCQVREEKTRARPCPDSHPAVSSTPPVEAPPLLTCLWASPIQAACRCRPLSGAVALSTATTATRTTLSTISITLHPSLLALYPFKSPAARWNGPVLCLLPVLAAAAAAVAAAMQLTTMTRYS